MTPDTIVHTSLEKKGTPTIGSLGKDKRLFLLNVHPPLTKSLKNRKLKLKKNGNQHTLQAYN